MSKEKTEKKKCAVCNGRGRILEKLDDEDRGSWMSCYCCQKEKKEKK